MFRASNPQKKHFAKRLMIALAAFLVGLLIIVYFENDAPQTAEQSLTDIENIDTLRTQFDRDAGKIRLIMIVSPT